MSAARAKETAADQSVVYVYGVARVPPSEAFAPLQLEGIVRDAPVQRLVRDNLVAFVSTVPTSQFGASELRSALADAEWLRGRIFAHEKILKELRSSYGVVPFRFCTIYRNAALLLNALARHRAELDQAIDRVGDASEWGVKLYYDPEALRCQVEVASKAIRQLRETLTGASPGAQFFLRKKYDRALDAEVAASIAVCVEHSRRCLDECARGAAEIQVQSPAEHGWSEAMVMNAAYLVDKGALGGFQRALAALRAEFAEPAFSYELTGPWPPYHFVSTRREGIEDAAASNQ
jgi:hypothetical protein